MQKTAHTENEKPTEWEIETVGKILRSEIKKKTKKYLSACAELNEGKNESIKENMKRWNNCEKSHHQSTI